MSRLSLDLLSQAGMLARREPRKPKEASLRRSISTSYYALFHYLIEESTRLSVGTSNDRARFREFAGRAFVHGKMKSVCEEFSKSTPKSELLNAFWPRLSVPTCGDIRTIAENFVDLQEQRHAADYDLSRRFKRHDAQRAFDQAQEAIDAWKRLKEQEPDISLLFALSLMLWPGLGAR
jgi:uncharacterized protein (UPF0332 family)